MSPPADHGLACANARSLPAESEPQSQVRTELRGVAFSVTSVGRGVTLQPLVEASVRYIWGGRKEPRNLGKITSHAFLPSRHATAAREPHHQKSSRRGAASSPRSAACLPHAARDLDRDALRDGGRRLLGPPHGPKLRRLLHAAAGRETRPRHPCLVAPQLPSPCGATMARQGCLVALPWVATPPAGRETRDDASGAPQLATPASRAGTAVSVGRRHGHRPWAAWRRLKASHPTPHHLTPPHTTSSTSSARTTAQAHAGWRLIGQGWPKLRAAWGMLWR